MAAKPESNYIARVHKHLSSDIYHEKMYNPLRRGTPDVWYSGSGGDLWIEYKYVPKVPKTGVVPTTLLSSLQALWLTRRMNEGRTVRVVIGSSIGSVILLADSINQRLFVGDFVLSAKDVAINISLMVTK